MAKHRGSLRPLVLALVFGAFPAGVLAACAEEEPRPPLLSGGGGGGNIGGGSSGPTRDGSADAADASGDAGTCTELVNSGILVDQLAVTGDPLPGSGGAITDGTYELNDARVYVGAGGLPGSTGATYQSTLRVAGTSFERVTRFVGAGGIPAETRSVGTLAIAAAQVTFSVTCPAPTQEVYAFGVTNATVTFTSATTRESLSYLRR